MFKIVKTLGVLALAAGLIYGGMRIYKDNNSKLVYLEGTLNRGVKLAQDVEYNFLLKLDTVVSGPTFEDGRGIPLSDYYLIATDSVIYSELESRLDKRVKVGGEINWGYAETKYLKVLTIK